MGVPIASRSGYDIGDITVLERACVTLVVVYVASEHSVWKSIGRLNRHFAKLLYTASYIWVNPCFFILPLVIIHMITLFDFYKHVAIVNEVSLVHLERFDCSGDR
jgi:hypothetical protein